MKALSDFVNLDQLTIEAPVIEDNRVWSNYNITDGSKTDTIKLCYKYENKKQFLNLENANTHNLASMITAQVAINYGLFFKTIFFKGLFDETDKKFILDVFENTSREIYVNKLLKGNLFLTESFKHVECQKLKKYTQAKIVFESDAKKDSKLSWQLWNTDKSKYAILSSGGKDSLLTYGILNELNKETYPIFINESGRHWYTAINAYKHFKENIPNTQRVWTNADRVYNWVLRHLSFIKKDFANIRSDGYPIRLWTVAVFLFGALPILHNNNVGRLLIGDEYDTTMKSKYKGITHYAGLFDQSRYFDILLSRYFLRKGWMISQFSILRNLSEILIQGILYKRYPLLCEKQVSCHAASIMNNIACPCGKCEKCRRIISMLLSVDENPEKLGYTKEQIKRCLKSVNLNSIHQEKEAVKQLIIDLEKKNIIKFNAKNLKAHPEVFKLRFDPDKSPIETIPNDLRKDVFKIFLKYSNGVCKKANKTWDNFDLFNDSGFNKRYPFESVFKTKKEKIYVKLKKESYLLGELTWLEAKLRFLKVDIALLPVGAIEQHGPHLPLDTDSFDANYLANEVANSCSDPKPLVLPLIPYGISYHHDDFPGTISISNRTLSNLVYDIGISLVKNGIKKLIIINGHGGNTPSLNYAAQQLNKKTKAFVCVDSGESSDVDIYKLIETPNDVHSGEVETSTSLVTRPHLINRKLFKKSIPRFTTNYLDFTNNRSVRWYAHTKKFSENGVIGDPTKASEEKGKKIWQIMISHLVSIVENVKKIPLDEIYQKKY
ncbi:MAG: creatininase family protein [Pseudomonadota bacterium]